MKSYDKSFEGIGYIKSNRSMQKKLANLTR